jgi:squalene cyclase
MRFTSSRREPRRHPRGGAASFPLASRRGAEEDAEAEEPLVGVFNKACLINYDNYRFYFPLWAMGELSAAAA